MNKEVISDSFIITLADGTEKEYIKEGNVEYIWSLTPAGDVLVYLKEYHGTFQMAAVRDERHCAYAKGTWTYIVSRPDLNQKKEEGNEREESEVPASAIIH